MIYRILKIVLVMFIASSCMAYKGENLTYIENLSSNDSSKTFALINVNFNKSSAGAYGYGKEDDYKEDDYTDDKIPSKSEEKFKNIVKEEIKKSGFLKGYTFNEDSKEKDLKIDITMEIKAEEGIHNLSLFFSAYTLSILPGYQKHNFILTCAVYDNKDNLLKEYSYGDTMTSWYEILLLPFALTKNPFNLKWDITANMTRHLLQDMKEDEFI